MKNAREIGSKSAVIKELSSFPRYICSGSQVETTVKPAIEEFLKTRGLTLSPEKTAITYIKDGFSFLGQDIRKFGRKLIITPSKKGVLALIRTIGDLIRRHTSAPMDVFITKLNSLLRGWANYHRHVAASRAFRRVDSLRIRPTVAHAPPQT